MWRSITPLNLTVVFILKWAFFDFAASLGTLFHKHTLYCIWMGINVFWKIIDMYTEDYIETYLEIWDSWFSCFDCITSAALDLLLRYNRCNNLLYDVRRPPWLQLYDVRAVGKKRNTSGKIGTLLSNALTERATWGVLSHYLDCLVIHCSYTWAGHTLSQIPAKCTVSTTCGAKACSAR
jgi:hypothetical protein